MKKLLTLIYLLTCLSAFAVEDDNLISVNQLDSLGVKTGLWVDNYNWIFYYNNGVKNGPGISIEPNSGSPFISEIIFTKQDNLEGSFIMFHPNGVIAILFTNLTPNTNFKGKQICYSKDFDFKYQSYCMEFYPNGKLQAEGWYILGEEIEVDLERVGIWKFYSEDGTVEEVNFSDPNIETRHSR